VKAKPATRRVAKPRRHRTEAERFEADPGPKPGGGGQPGNTDSCGPLGPVAPRSSNTLVAPTCEAGSDQGSTPCGSNQMSSSIIVCANCGVSVLKDNREINRNARVGRRNFCTISCAAVFSNKDRRVAAVTATCPCGKPVHTSTKRRATKHCSRGCASLYSVTPTRIKAAIAAGHANSGNLLTQAEALRKRESWKYALLEKCLRGVPHQFEFPVSGFVFGLVLYEAHTLVEFDGPDHRGTAQRALDSKKDSAANKAGYFVRRVAVEESSVIPVSALYWLRKAV
jgi:very-short-patch-repair endonuclease